MPTRSRLFAARHAATRASSLVAALSRRLPGGWLHDQLAMVFDIDWYRAQGGAGDLGDYLQRGWEQGFDPHPLFRTRWYLATYPDVAAMRICPLVHYLSCGWAEGRDPAPAFCGWWYHATNADIDRSLNPWVHWVVHGAAEGRAPSPLFDPRAYCQSASGVALGDAYRHYHAEGWSQGFNPHPLFDTRWYAAAYPGAAPGTDPLDHYLAGGWREGHWPNPLCNPLWYHHQYPDSQWLEPLSHHDWVGRQHGYRLTPLFDERFYRLINPVLNREDDALAHYLRVGWRHDLDPNPFFDGVWYRAQCEQLDRAAEQAAPPFGDFAPIGHYWLHGYRLRRQPSPVFDPAWYREAHADVAGTGQDPFEHFLSSGAADGRAPMLRDVPLAPRVEVSPPVPPSAWLVTPPAARDGASLVLLACHDQRGSYGRAVRHQVRAYRDAGWTVLVGFDHALAPDALVGVDDEERAHGILALPHAGYDFYTWRLLWEALGEPDTVERVLLTNDSVVGPFGSLRPLTRTLEAHPAEVLGFVESSELMVHLQSWGVVFQRRPLTERMLGRYLAQVAPGQSKPSLIGRLEYQLARLALLHGYSVASLCSPVGQLLCSVNPSIHGWRHVLRGGLPFVKREVFTLAAYQTRQIGRDVVQELQQQTDIDVEALVSDSLAQVGLDAKLARGG